MMTSKQKKKHFLITSGIILSIIGIAIILNYFSVLGIVFIFLGSLVLATYFIGMIVFSAIDLYLYINSDDNDTPVYWLPYDSIGHEVERIEKEERLLKEQQIKRGNK